MREDRGVAGDASLLQAPLMALVDFASNLLLLGCATTRRLSASAAASVPASDAWLTWRMMRGPAAPRLGWLGASTVAMVRLPDDSRIRVLDGGAEDILLANTVGLPWVAGTTRFLAFGEISVSPSGSGGMNIRYDAEVNECEEAVSDSLCTRRGEARIADCNASRVRIGGEHSILGAWGAGEPWGRDCTSGAGRTEGTEGAAGAKDPDDGACS